ncbi:MAG: histidine phosphatase family protein [Rhodospirillaceae bacterium]|jgi:2,3-bisphosphoglycerate-dependent phosphoglycerate mutase|nr:histidine phosphatase family protein [Rhodospirillales bacterium]MBT6406939.1 histidine phosphatase family protein [Rhodospirillaceae bacterium]
MNNRAGAVPFVFVRHGQTETNVRGLLAGSTDVALTDQGIREAELAADLLTDTDIGIICSSPLQRARRTAEVTAARHALPVTIIDELRERNWGELEGKAFPSDLGNPQPPGGESLDDYVSRVDRALTRFFRMAPDGHGLLVAHAGTFDAMCRLFGIRNGAAVIGNARPIRFDPPEKPGAPWHIASI